MVPHLRHFCTFWRFFPDAPKTGWNIPAHPVTDFRIWRILCGAEKLPQKNICWQ
jgi:hypothetical protein